MKHVRKIGHRRKGCLFEYDGDGRFDERWDAADKRYWKRWLRRVGKKDVAERTADIGR